MAAAVKSRGRGGRGAASAIVRVPEPPPCSCRGPWAFPAGAGDGRGDGSGGAEREKLLWRPLRAPSAGAAHGSQLPRSVLSKERLLVFRGDTGLGGLLRLELLEAVECLGESESCGAPKGR